jgi:hypothetical protein
MPVIGVLQKVSRTFIFSAMRGTLDHVCYSMERDPSNLEVQIKCIGALFKVLRLEKDLPPFTRAFQAVSKAIETHPNSAEVIIEAVQLFTNLVHESKLLLVLQETDIADQLLFILCQVKDILQICDMTLSVIAVMMELHFVAGAFSSVEFVECLVSIARIHPTSDLLAGYLTKIVLELSVDYGVELKELASCFVVMSRTFTSNEKLEGEISAALVKISDAVVMESLAPVVLPQLAKVCRVFPDNFQLFDDLLVLASRAAHNVSISPLVSSEIVAHQKGLWFNGEALERAISILAHRVPQKRRGPEFVPIALMALDFAFMSPEIVKDSLAVLFHGMSQGNKQIGPDAFHALTSVLWLHPNETAIVKRVSVILHSLRANTDELVKSGATCALFQAIRANIEDQETASIGISSLASFVDASPILAEQIQRDEFVKGLKTLFEIHSKELRVARSVFVIMSAIVRAVYGFDRFLHLPPESKSIYSLSMDSETDLISDHPFCQAFLLICDSPDVDYAAIAMKTYPADREIQLCGLFLGVSDLEALKIAISLCGQDALQFVLPLLRKLDTTLPSQIIQLLLLMDRNEVAEILLLHFRANSQASIAAQFEFRFLSQIELAYELFRIHEWGPERHHLPMLRSGLLQYRFSPRQLYLVLFFLQMLALDNTYFVYLLNAIHEHPRSAEIVTLSGNMISSLCPTEELEKDAAGYNSISILAFALGMYQEDETVTTSQALLNALHFFSGMRSLSESFAQSGVIPVILKLSSKWERFVPKVSCILSNIIDCELVLDYLSTPDILELCFSVYTPSTAVLVSELLRQFDWELSKSQFEILEQQLTSKTPLIPFEAYHLLYAVVMSLHRGLALKKKIDRRVLSQFLMVYQREPTIIELVLELFAYSDKWDNDSDLLFLLLEAIRANLKDLTVVIAIVQLLPKFEKQKASLGVPETLKLFVSVLEEHPTDPVIASVVFELLIGHAEAWALGLRALRRHQDQAALTAISHYLQSVAQQVNPTRSIGKALATLAAQNDSVDICSNLLSLIFYASADAQTHEQLILEVKTLAAAALRNINNLNVCRAFVGIARNLSNTPGNINEIAVICPVVILAMTVFPADGQVISIGCLCISQFVSAQRGTAFVSALPVLILALRNRVTVEMCCQAICELCRVTPEYTSAIASELINLIRREENKKDPATCLLSIAHISDCQDSIFSRIGFLFETCSPVRDEELSMLILHVCARLTDTSRMETFEGFVPTLRTLLTSDQPKLALAAGHVCLNLAQHRPQTLATLAPMLLDLSKSRSALGSVCSGTMALYRGDSQASR